ncbi:MAG: 6,7-dimethyl-8-ribityllumazine synthase [Pseudomonadota bacterium]
MNQINSNQLLNGQKIAFIQAAWHDDIVGQGRESFIAEMEKAGFATNQIDVFDVPGSLEIPLQSKWIAETGDYAIIVACGFVVNGGIYRHDFVASTVIDGMMRVQLDTGVPILSVVLTPLNFHEHEQHQNYFFDHFKVKGAEAANACIKTLENRASFIQESKAA